MPAARLVPLLILACALAACGESADAPAGGPPGARPAGGPGAGGPGSGGGRGPGGGPVAVVTAPVRSVEFAQEIEALGTARANEAVEITSKVSNIVTAIRFDEGQRVAAGAILVELDAAQLRADLAAAEAALVESRAQASRSRALAATAALSGAQVDQIEATLKANEARVASARARLADSVIRAPFAGRTGLRRVSLGSLVAPGAVITTLDDTSPIKLDFSVPESFVSLIETGLAIEASSVAWPGEAFRGRVASVDSRVDPQSRSVTVRAEIPNADGRLKPGMFMTVRLQREVPPVLVLPEAAVVPEQGRTYVFVVAGGKAERREVGLGRRRPGEVEVVQGLRADERVIVEGTQKVRDGADVREAGAGGPDAPGTAGVRPPRPT